MKTSLAHCVTLIVTLLFCLGLITGCASSEQMQQVQTRVDSQYQTQQQIRQQLADQTKAMQDLSAQQQAFAKQQSKQMQDFANAYSPQVRAELAQNLKVSTDHRNEVARLLAASKHDRQEIAKMLSTSSRELAIIKQNRKESDVVNVVNQFEKLQVQFNKLNKTVLQKVHVLVTGCDQQVQQFVVSGSVGGGHRWFPLFRY